MVDRIKTVPVLKLRRDRALVKAILGGDQPAFCQFVDEYFPKLYRYAKHRLPCDADVEDVVQATLSQAARRLETYRGEATLLTWLVQICRHEISRLLHKAERRRDLMVPFMHDDLLRSVVEAVASDPGDDPEAQARRSEVITLVQFALDQLPNHYAQALELKYVEGFNSREIADRMQTSDEAMQSLLARARRAFREVCGEALHALYDKQGQTSSG